MTALPMAWLTLLAAAPGPRRLRRPACASSTRSCHGVPPGHPDRPRARPHPVGQGSQGSGRRRQRRRPAPPQPVPAPGPGPDGGSSSASTQPYAPTRPDLARGWADELAGFAEATGRPWALATVAYGRAMTAASGRGGAAVPGSAVPALRWPGRPLDEARTQLAYGEWLRRTQRRVDARQHLRQALETFQDVHAEALADRATQELRASGETARKRDPSTLVKLTPMELKVAQLVSSGPLEQGRRRAVLGLAAHRGLPPAQRLRQGRRHLTRRARPARARLTQPRPAHPGHLTGVSNGRSRPRSTAVPTTSLRERDRHERRHPPHHHPATASTAPPRRTRAGHRA